MLRDLVQPIGETALAAPPLYLLQAILQCLRYGFGFCFPGQGREIGSQFLSFVVSNVQCHVSLQVENFLHRYILARRATFLQTLGFLDLGDSSGSSRAFWIPVDDLMQAVRRAPPHNTAHRAQVSQKGDMMSAVVMSHPTD